MVSQKKEIKELKLQVTKLTLQLQCQAVVTSTRAKNTSDDSTTKVLANVKKLGTYFQSFCAPIVDAEVFNLPKPN